MLRVIIPDSGPLFSLAAGRPLHTLLFFDVHITDVVRSESIDKGNYPSPSLEATELLGFYNKNSTQIHTIATQQGKDVEEGRVDKNTRNLGELSIQGYLINFDSKPCSDKPIVLFEDGWFKNNEPSIYKDCLLLSTVDFLGLLEAMGHIASADQAFDDISSGRAVSTVTVTSRSLSSRLQKGFSAALSPSLQFVSWLSLDLIDFRQASLQTVRERTAPIRSRPSENGARAGCYRVPATPPASDLATSSPTSASRAPQYDHRAVHTYAHISDPDAKGNPSAAASPFGLKAHAPSTRPAGLRRARLLGGHLEALGLRPLVNARAPRR